MSRPDLVRRRESPNREIEAETMIFVPDYKPMEDNSVTTFHVQWVGVRVQPGVPPEPIENDDDSFSPVRSLQDLVGQVLSEFPDEGK